MTFFQKCFFWFWTGPFTYLIFWIILIFFQALQHRDGNNYDIFFRNAFSGSGLVSLHIRIGASLCLIAPPLQVQTETKTCQKTSVRLFQTSAAVDFKYFQENRLGEGRCLSLSVPTLPVRCSHFECY